MVWAWWKIHLIFLKVRKTPRNLKSNTFCHYKPRWNYKSCWNKQADIFSLSIFVLSKVQYQANEVEAYLENMPLPKQTNKQTLSCERNII